VLPELGEGRPDADTDVQQHLRTLLHPGGDVDERLADLPNRPEELKGGQEPVSRLGMVHEDDVARLLAAEIGAKAPHLLQHVAVPDARPRHLDAERGEGPLETEVGHHGRDDDAALEHAAQV
jgi:hypothetical protein